MGLIFARPGQGKEKMNWTNVKDAMPEVSTAMIRKAVLVYVPSLDRPEFGEDGIRFARWMGEPLGWWLDGGRGKWKVTHWMKVEKP